MDLSPIAVGLSAAVLCVNAAISLKLDLAMHWQLLVASIRYGSLNVQIDRVQHMHACYSESERNMEPVACWCLHDVYLQPFPFAMHAAWLYNLHY